jgi:thioester reductase-like protein
MDEEKEIEDGNALVGGYPQTKWVAERLARAAAARGLEVRIHRPAIVTPHPATFARSERDAFTTLLRAAVAVGAVPDLDLELNLVPVDFVASAIVALMLRGGGPGRYHLATGVPLHLFGVRQLLQRRGFEMDLVPFREWCGRALQHARRAGDDALQGLIPGLTERIGDRTLVEAMVETLAALRISSRRTSELLAREGLSARGAPELLSGYLDRFLKEGVMPPARPTATSWGAASSRR